MIRKIDGLCFKNMLDYGLRNLNKHQKIINKMNVFPVPDGDTGTNMMTTVQKGLTSVGEAITELSEISRRFAKTVVFEARGNSGVILSQFLKGVSEVFSNVDEADCNVLIRALENGVECAYSAVSTPVEGTMLTVLREATEAVKNECDGTWEINRVINSFVEHGKKSLDGTPELLPALKEAGVVDSGGAGVVYLFEGIKKYFDGDILEAAQDTTAPALDYSVFNEESEFKFGYCVEFLLQPLKKKGCFDYREIKSKLQSFGSSLVTSYDEGKVRVHIHTEYPEVVLSYCHGIGEFLSLKIENMSVQHSGSENKIIYSSEKERGAFSVVAVAFDRTLQKLFLEMGADAVIYSEESPSARDFIDAFEQLGGENILVFPNSSDAILSAVQAKKLYKESSVKVIGSRGIAECYASLPSVDFSETDVEAVADGITKAISNLYVVSIAGRNNSVYDGELRLEKKEYYAFSGKEIITVNPSLADAAIQTAINVSKSMNKEIITIFHKTEAIEDTVGKIVSALEKAGIEAEIFTVPTNGMNCEIVISFE